jgi:stage III sporulation protein AF
LKGKNKVINFIITWAKGIIISVIIATIIEMILPNGSSNKYIKVVIGIYIIFNIITPVINKITNNSFSIETIMDISKYTNQLDTYEISTQKLDSNNDTNIKEIYKVNLEKDIKSKIEEKGYTVNSVSAEINDDEEYTIKSITMNVSKKEDNKEDNSNTVNKIEEVNISVSIENRVVENTNDEISNSEKKELKEYISSTYSVSTKKINI